MENPASLLGFNCNSFSFQVVAFGRVVGKLGVLHPETLAKFELALPAAAMEINIEPFL